MENERTITKPLKKEQFKKIEKYGNEERELYLGLICEWCRHIDVRGFVVCPSCRYRYTKLLLIDKLIDGHDVWNKFKDNDSNGNNIKDELREIKKVIKKVIK